MDTTNLSLGIEFGSTRIKAVLIDSEHKVLAVGSHIWENELKNGVWTYPMEAIIGGMQDCYADLKRSFESKYGLALSTVGAIGVSAMMHGYLPLDKNNEPLTEFRTWRNTMTAAASKKLTELFDFHIPQRWCVAHLYQAILNNEPHVKDIAVLTTLAGYIHFRLTGQHAVGLGEGSGIVPLDPRTLGYDEAMLRCFDSLVAHCGYLWHLEELLPRLVPAGRQAGTLTASGALLLDPSGALRPGIPFAPCEGDADTGLIATNSVRERSGSVSAGTSSFAMIVTDRPLGVHREVDMFCTPSGKQVAMVHSSNCTSDINAWVSLLSEFASLIGSKADKSQLYSLLFNEAMRGESDCGGLLSFNCFSGESVTGLDDGRPVLVRTPDSRLTLANFMRAHLLSALVSIKLGLDILRRDEGLRPERLCAQGGFFKTPKVGQLLLSAAADAPVSVMETAGEGGPYGMALLCAFMLWHGEGESLEDYLDKRVFRSVPQNTVMAERADIEGFNEYARRYLAALPIEEAAIRHLK